MRVRKTRIVGSGKKTTAERSRKINNKSRKKTTGRFGKSTAENLLEGRVIANPKGFGFVAVDGDVRDFRLSPAQMKTIFHGDRVRVRATNYPRGCEIVEIVKRTETVVGRLRLGKDAILIVDDYRILHPVRILRPPKNCKNDQMVVVKILRYPTKKHPPSGEVVEILGDYQAPGVEIKSALYRHKIPTKFSRGTISEVEKIASEIPRENGGRVDCRDFPFVTIDGENAKDFDDAVFAKSDNDGWKLWVAIADVSHFVSAHSALDQDAYRRGTSVYFPNRVVPMLPKKLSENLCSLVPDQTRLSLVCEMHINHQGEVLNYQFYEALIRSSARLYYHEVHQFLTGKKTIGERNIADNLHALFALYRVLKTAREQRGALDFDRAEAAIHYDENGKIATIKPQVRNDAHRLIEECMLLANQQAAKFLTRARADFLHRIHPAPDGEKIALARQFLSALGLTLGGGENPKPADFAEVLRTASGRDDFDVIQTVVLRTMNQAVYAPKNAGHFGLALNDYTHFTSPIRRYPDLLVHRAIKHTLKRQKNGVVKIAEMGEHLSMTERRADDCARDVEKWHKCEYMKNHLGAVFDGRISGVAGFGIFVELADIFIEGLVPIQDLADDYYIFDDAHHRLIGQRRGRVFRLGDGVRIKVLEVRLESRSIIFRLDAATKNARAKNRKMPKNQKITNNQKMVKNRKITKNEKMTKNHKITKNQKTAKYSPKSSTKNFCRQR